jgi:hypothetical protein
MIHRICFIFCLVFSGRVFASNDCTPLLIEGSKLHFVSGDGHAGSRPLLLTTLTAGSDADSRFQMSSPVDWTPVQILEATDQPPIVDGDQIVELQNTPSPLLRADHHEVGILEDYSHFEGIIPWPHLEDETVKMVTACHLPVILLPTTSSSHDAFRIAWTGFAAARQCVSDGRLVVDSFLPNGSPEEQIHLAVIQLVAASVNHVDELRIHVRDAEVGQRVTKALDGLRERTSSLHDFEEALSIIEGR